MLIFNIRKSLIRYNFILCVFHLLIITQLTLTDNACQKSENWVSYPSSQNARLNITAEYDLCIRIECSSMSYYKFKSLLPPYNESLNRRVRDIEIFNCPLPDDGSSINRIPQQLGASSYKKLVIENNQLDTNLLKYHFMEKYGIEELVIRLNHLSYAEDELFSSYYLQNLKILRFYANITELPRNIFTNLDTLVHLNIGYNLDHLPNNIFQNQTNLLHLDMSSNKLKNITKDMFGNNLNVKSINLKDNEIETFPFDAFELLINLTSIDLNRNTISELPEHLFKNNINLHEFILTENRFALTRLPQNLLANLPALKRVHLRFDLEQVPENLFQNSTKIIYINMSYNKLKTLPANLFASQIDLEKLDLSHNQLENIPNALFNNVENLKILNLANNNIKGIESNTFFEVKNLLALYLDNNQLESATFEPNLSGNQILKVISLRHNSLDQLHISIPHHLQKLDLSYNKITRLRSKLLTELCSDNLSLNLTYNQIENVDLENFEEHINCLPEIIKITTDLNSNPIQCDCKLLESIKYLNGVNWRIQFNIKNLTCNQPQSLKGRLLKQVESKELICPSGDSIDCPKRCNCWRRPYDKILIVNCSNGNLIKIPTLPKIDTLNINAIELHLENNPILDLPDRETIGYANVTKLFIARNNLTDISKLKLPKELTDLDLESNKLKSLDIETLRYLNESKYLKNISLSENPYSCNCNEISLTLFRFTQINNPKFIDSSQMRCWHESELIYLHELQDLCYNDNCLWITIAIVFMIIFLLIAFYYRYQKVIKILLYAHGKLPRCFAVYEDDDPDKLYDAFVAYSNKDQEFIEKHLMPELESGEPSFKLCIPDRDWLAGECIVDTIVNSINMSKRTIVVLSPDFINSDWSKIIFETAHQAALDERRPRLIVIVYKDVGKIKNLNSDIKLYIKVDQCIKWGEKSFWKTLRFAMPHI